MKIIEINIQEPYYSYIINGQKIVEGRLNKGKFTEAEIGDILRINNSVDFKLIGKNIYKNFKDMILKEGIKNVIPDKEVIEEAVNIYYQFYTTEQEKKFGVVALKIEAMGKV